MYTSAPFNVPTCLCNSVDLFHSTLSLSLPLARAPCAFVTLIFVHFSTWMDCAFFVNAPSVSWSSSFSSPKSTRPLFPFAHCSSPSTLLWSVLIVWVVRARVFVCVCHLYISLSVDAIIEADPPLWSFMLFCSSFIAHYADLLPPSEGPGDPPRGPLVVVLPLLTLYSVGCC